MRNSGSTHKSARLVHQNIWADVRANGLMKDLFLTELTVPRQQLVHLRPADDPMAFFPMAGLEKGGRISPRHSNIAGNDEFQDFDAP